MDLLPSLFACVRLTGWALLHFMWQAVLLGLLYAIGRAVLPRGEARYRFGMATLAVLAVCPLLTIWRMLGTSTSDAAVTIYAGSFTARADTLAAGDTWSWQGGLEALLPWLVLAWSLGVFVLSLRAWRQWRGLQELVRQSESMPLWQERGDAMAARFGLRRRVTVLCSRIIGTPALVGGWIRPVILLPVAVACNFPARQIELILAHEMAHLRRWDPLANLFQVVLETLHFYHPVVHWISSDVRNEREICCDEMALSIGGGSRHEFVRMLADLGELREQQGSLLLAASGGVLLDRAQQMVLPRTESARSRASARFVAIVLGAALMTLAVQVERRQAQFQQSLGASIGQLQALVVAPWLPRVGLQPSWRMPALAPLRAVPAVPAITIDHAIAGAGSSGISLMHQGAAAALRPLAVQLPVSDLAGLHAPTFPRIDEKLVPAGKALVPPRAVRMRQPVYPQAAMRNGVEGQVEVEFNLGSDGSVQNLNVISAAPTGVFERAAIQAMRDWKYDVSTPVAAAPLQKYRQTLAFTLNAAEGGHAPARGRDDARIQARTGCQVVTGTHICRWPEDASLRGGPVGASGD